MDLIDPKKAGVDPLAVGDILKRVDWILKAVEAIIIQLAAKFHFDLPPQP